MEFIPWSTYYEEWKDKKPLNEIVANYNMWKFQYETYQHSLWLNGGSEETIVDEPQDINYLLLEDGGNILLEDGGYIIL